MIMLYFTPCALGSGVMSQNIWGGAQFLRGSEATKPEGA